MSTLVRKEAEADLEPAVVSVSRPRLDSIDLIRGLVMVIMALDHTKGYFTNIKFDFLDPNLTSPVYFFTRWISHYCAPTFIFLAGTGAFLYGARGRSKGQLSWFLLSRGLWIVILEETWIHFAWDPTVPRYFFFGGVLWAIGWSMVALAALVELPTPAVIAFGLLLIFGHNSFDKVKAADFGRYGGLWGILHSQEAVNLSSQPLAPTQIQWPPTELVFSPQYPLIPWIGVMACGYGLGTLYLLPAARRRAWLLAMGTACVILFIGLRWLNFYGDPFPWKPFATPTQTFLSFLNCHKYPPSLLFLLMTLGPAMIALAIAELNFGWIGQFFVTFGRVPMFYYLIHIPLIQALAVALAYWQYGRVIWPSTRPPDYGYDLAIVYATWIGVVAIMYLPCLWFSRLKQRSKAAWLSYF